LARGVRHSAGEAWAGRRPPHPQLPAALLLVAWSSGSCSNVILCLLGAEWLSTMMSVTHELQADVYATLW
jgi:hypothetical protein